MKIIEEQNLFQTVSEVELIYRSKVPVALRPKIKRSDDSYRLLKDHWDSNKIAFVEQFKVLYLNRANHVLALYEISSGGLTGTVADARLIFASALKLNASALILAHNHPSGNLDPSQADKALTDKIKNAGRFLDIQVFDHLILSSEGYFSFADEGLM